MANLAVSEGKQVARPLHVLVPLIKKDLADAKEAAEAASAPYYKAAADKFVEARGQVTYSEFLSWANRNFDVKETQARRYLTIGKSTTFNSRAAPLPETMSGALREIGESPRGPKHPTWHEPIKEQMSAASNIRNLHAEAQVRAEERDIERKLAQKLIDIGFKALATELHPDKPGGSKDAMARLNRVRDKLKSVYA